VHHLTGGKPYFVAEVVRTAGRGLPASARDAVLGRAELLDADLDRRVGCMARLAGPRCEVVVGSMLAAQLARHYPTVTLGTDALEAARILADARLPGLIVLDDDGQPYTVLPGSQVLRFIVPTYVQEDPALARAYDEASADSMCDELAARTVREVLPKRVDLFDLPVVASDATSIEIAAVMAGQRSPIVAVMDGSRFVGAVVVSTLLEHLLGGGSTR
jgi:CBS domain-containing protein